MEVSTIYNPHEQTEQELLEGFVIREKEFKTIFNDIEKNKMQTPPQHYIIYGIRGNGKTSLLLKLFYEVKRDDNLNKWLIPIIFKEEQYNVRTLYKLWENIAEYLADDYDEFSDLPDKMELYENSDDYEEKCFEILQKILQHNGKKIVLFFDNFGVFLNKLKDKEHKRLREVLITCADMRIVGASTFVDEATYDYGKPFFDFFKPVYLKGLNREDTIKLLLKLNEKATSGDVKEIIEKNPGRIEALRRLTSGIPRTIVLLYQIFVDNANGDSFKDLDALLDKVTPLYKSRMDDLPAQQQEIADIIAKNWDAITVKEIAKKAKMPSNAVSAQLKQLEKNRIITKKSTSTKNNMYQITERFFNIWYLMRYSRKKDKCKVRWLVNFLEIWCDKKELKTRVKKHLDNLKSGQLYDKYAYHLSEAYAQIVVSSKMQHNIIVSTRKYLKEIKSDYLNELSNSDIELELAALKDIKNEKPDLALVKLLKIERKNKTQLFLIGLIYHEFINDLSKAEEFYLLAIKKNMPEAMLNLAYIYNSIYEDHKMAEKYYLMAAKKGSIEALVKLGLLFEKEYKDYLKAEKYYLMAAEKDNIEGMSSLAYLYDYKNKDYENAKKYYLLAIEKDDTRAMVNLGYLYDIVYEDEKKAEKFYLMALERGEKEAAIFLGALYHKKIKDYEKAINYYLIATEKGDTLAMVFLGMLYTNEYKDYKNAEKYYLMAIDKGDTKAMVNLGGLYENEYKDYKNAEKYYLMAIDKGDTFAMVNLGGLCEDEYKDYKKAEKYYLMAIDKGDTFAMVLLGLLYTNEYKDYKKAEKYYLMAIDKGDTKAMVNLGVIYENEYKDYKKAENYYLMAKDKGDTKAIVNLGGLYKNEYKDYKKAERYYLAAIEKNNSSGMNGLAWHYFELKRNKIEALKYAKEAFEIKNNIYFSHTYSCILLWHNEIEKAIEISKIFLDEENSYSEFSEDIELFLLLLLAKKQYHYVLNLFKENKFEIQDRFKPIYYALMSLMQEEFPDEILRMGSELEETVQEILEQIEKLSKDYA